MSKRPVDVLIEDILEAIEKVERYTDGMTLETFQSDEKTADSSSRVVVFKASNVMKRKVSG
jgi:uncharacterized protein with HEPN domain